MAVFLAFLAAGLLLLSGRVLILWWKERRVEPGSGIPLRRRFYAYVGGAASLAFLVATDFKLPALAGAILFLVPTLLKVIEQAFLWLRRDERPRGVADFSSAAGPARQQQHHLR